MFREMRRKKQNLSSKECASILKKGTAGTLALLGDDGYPYAVPLNYFYDDNSEKIYFHCAMIGHKIDAIKNNAKASFCVIGQDVVVPEEFADYYKSVIVFGSIRIVEDEAEKITAVTKLTKKYCPDESDEGINKEIEKFRSSLCILEFSIEHTTGKQALGLAIKR